MKARELALTAAIEASQRHSTLQEVFSKLLEGSGLDRRDKALAEEIAFGSLRRRITLDAVISHISKHPLHRIQPVLLEAIRQGAYQLLLLDRVPPHAVGHETVELVKTRLGRSAANFANAVLRALTGLISQKAVERPTEQLAPRALASRNGRFVILSIKLWPDPRRDLPGWLAGSYGYPMWMVRRWLERLGPEQAERILEWGNTPGALSVRLKQAAFSPGGPTPEEAAQAFAGCKSFTKGDVDGIWRIEPEVAPRELPGLLQGLFTIQDETQARPALLLAPPEGAEVLELCSGLGGKTTQLAELVGASGKVVALDRDSSKLQQARIAAERLGLKNITFIEGDALSPPPEAARDFQYVLIDAPCSNMGALDKRPEVRFRASEDALKRLAEQESKLLSAAMERVLPGGSLVYSVCSFEEEETHGVISDTLKARSDFRLASECLVLPLPGLRDGGYCARLVRSS